MSEWKIPPRRWMFACRKCGHPLSAMSSKASVQAYRDHLRVCRYLKPFADLVAAHA